MAETAGANAKILSLEATVAGLQNDLKNPLKKVEQLTDKLTGNGGVPRRVKSPPCHTLKDLE
eukprot:1183596-Prorocentrum_minimum.AAC.3